MNIEVAKEVIDWFLMRACLFALAVLSGLFLFVVLSRVLARLKSAVKRYGWPIVTLFVVFSSWATYTAFPTAEEKNGSQGSGISSQGSVVRGQESGIDTNSTVCLNSSPSPKLTPNPYPLSLIQEDFARGFVLTRIGTNEVHDFAAPSGAGICEDWNAFGAAEDWVYLEGSGVSSSGLGRERLRVHSDGWVTVLSPTSSVFVAREYYPFKASLGIVPEANRELVISSQESGVSSQGAVSGLTPNPYLLTPNSCFWHCFTPSNTLQLTWQNVLYNRESDMPISVQAEFYGNGDFIYRYDLSAIKAKIDSGVIPENFPSNITIGTIPHSLFPVPQSPFPTSLFFRHLDSSDTPGSDRDGDGLIIEDELFVYHTDPYNADSDYDGLTDYDEIFIVKSNPLDAYSISNDYYDGLASVLNGEDPFSYPQGSTNTVLEHVFYSGSTNGVFSLPVSTDETAVLKVCVSGSGVGRFVVGEKVVPLVGSSTGLTRFTGSGNNEVSVTNTLLLTVGKGVKKSIWFTKPDGLELAIDSDDFMIGELPSLLWPHGWIAFPHTEATVPCIHDFNGKGRVVSLLHGEEFEGMTASWSSGTSDVVITNVAPVSAEIYGHFKKNQTREISYRVNHPKQLNTAIAHFTQTLRFCPQFTEDEEPPEELPEEDEDDRYWDCMCGVNAPCFCGEDEWCFCYSPDCRCNENRSPTITDNEDDEVEFENILEELTPSVNALYLYRDNERTVHLEVPDGEPRRCCPCPEHWKSNYVSKALYTSRLSVNDAAGDDFNISYEPCSVTVSGVSPSKSFRDSTVSFITNGIAYKRLDYTVLGIKISRGEWDVPFETYNQLSPQLGFPFEVCTDINNAERFYLNTDVLMTNGYVRISLEDVTGEFKIWLPSWYDTDGHWHDYEVLLDSETKRVRYMSMSKWKNILRRYYETTSLEVRVTSSTAGSCKLKLEYLAADGDNYIHDFAEQRITSVNPPVRFDLTRDGAVSDEDIDAFLNGRIFRYWTNEDTVKGDYIGAVDDDDSNIDDDVVNGTYDLVNFFPAALDFQQFVEAWGTQVKYIIKSSWDNESPFNVCFANLPWEKAGEIQTANVTTTTGMALSSAQLIPLDRNGIEIPYDMLVQFSQNSGVMICEALKPNKTIYVDIKLGDEVLYTYTAPMSISSVREMYRWLNLRPVVNDHSGETSKMWTPNNYPDEECDGKHFIFVHGYNVNASSARIWADVIFKRLWLAGSKSKFTAVDWRGDESQIYVPTQGDVSPNYYINVRHAFMTAEQAAININGLSGEKIMLAHSLGNMLVSSAAKDYGLAYSKYFMINAAVPMEAYDEDVNNSLMIDGAWSDIPESMRASRYSDLFSHTPNDFRLGLSWKGRFAGIQNAVNCYSPTEDVLKNPKVNKIFGMSAGSDFGGAWSQQELFKGCTLWYGVNSIAFSGAEIEGGWGINARYMANPLAYIPLSGFNPSYFSEYTREDIITKPLFTGMNDERMSTTNVLDFVDANLRAKMLGDAIPAESFAAGANQTGGGVLNYNMQIDTPNGWPRKNDSEEPQWHHSDIKNVSFYYTYKFFEKIMKGE